VGKPINILIVDDSAVMRAVIRRAVALSGAAVEAVHDAPDGASALHVLEAHAIDVVFTDINMPGMNGVELLREIVARGWTHLTRIVVSTDSSGTRRDEVAALGVSLMVEKPFAPEAIRDVLAVSH
jgi:two-component system chemotaxis response regulator CheY